MSDQDLLSMVLEAGAMVDKLETTPRNHDENKWGIADSLELADDLALVLDIHHLLCYNIYIN